MSNNLNELNRVLFDTLRQVKSKKVDSKQAQSIVGIGNAIINSAKLQLNAAKHLKGATISTDFFGDITVEQQRKLPMLKENKKVTFSNPKNLYDRKLEFALSLGYSNIADAYAGQGRADFENKFKATLNNE